MTFLHNQHQQQPELPRIPCCVQSLPPSILRLPFPSLRIQLSSLDGFLVAAPCITIGVDHRCAVPRPLTLGLGGLSVPPSMEHFNTTIYNGRLVSSRKGIITSKSKHQGTRFVNSFASPATTAIATRPPEAPAQREPQEVRSNDDEESRPNEQAETLMSDRDPNHMNSPPKTATSPGSTATMRRTTEPPETPMSNASEALDQEESSPRPGTAATQHSLNIGYLRPPVPKGNPTTQTPPPRQSGRSQPPPDDDTAALAQRLVQQYLHNVPQRSHTYEAIALVASLANGGGSVSPAELGPSISNVCASMNRGLLIGDDDGRRSELAVVESIAAMAIEATYSGRQDHWHVLMRGLRDIVDRGGGMKAEWGDTLNKIRK